MDRNSVLVGATDNQEKSRHRLARHGEPSAGLTTGKSYEIRHPDLIMVGRRSAVIGIANQPGGTAYDRTFKVDLFHVVGVEELAGFPSPGNGPAGNA